MAKFGPYYGLCPLIDHKSLLGISGHEEKGTVVVTLGKNIAIKHRISDQKQLHSWRTKEKFSSPVIYDFENSKYVAVFNQTLIRLWTGEEEHLDKVKKLKFDYPIHTLISSRKQSFIIFRNGNIIPLSKAIDLRKTLVIKAVIEENDIITDVLDTTFGNDIYIGLMITNNKKNYLFWTVYNEELQATKFFKILLEKGSLELTGYVFHKKRDSVLFLTLWSDGRMFSNILLPNDTSVDLSGELFTAIDSLNYKQFVSMVSLDENYVAMYGADCNEEGASLIIYNSHFRVTQSTQAFKLFTKGAKLWCIEDNILLPVGQNLAVIPFYLATEQLAALVGSHKTLVNELDEDISIVQEVADSNWGTKSSLEIPELPKQIQEKVTDLCKQGLPDSTIIEYLLPDILEKQDTATILHILNLFYDIPDKILIRILKVILNPKDEPPKAKCKSKIQLRPSKHNIIDIILGKSFSGTSVLPFLRSLLDLDDVLMLIEYICYMLSEDGHCLPYLNELQTEEKLIDWISLLLDANFQKLLLTKDERCLALLKTLSSLIDDKLETSKYLDALSALLTTFKKGNRVKNCGMGNATYSIEVVNLY